MAVESRLDIILNFIKKGKGAKEAKKEMGGLAGAVKKASKESKDFTLKQIAAKLSLTAVTLAVIRQLPQMADLGFKYKNAQIALEAYAGSAFEATQITNAVTEASGFAIDKFAAVTNATRLLSLGLANNAEEAAEFTRVAVNLGATMGKDVQGAFEEFSLLLANQSILRLDTYGISAGKVREEMARLAAEFPELDRNTRFVNATMTIAADKLSKLEEAGFQATSSLDRLSAKGRDFKTEFGGFIADAVESALQPIFDTTDSLREQANAILETSDTYDEYIEKTTEAGIVGGLFTESTAILNRELAEQTIEARKAAEAGIELANAQEEVILTAGGINELLQEQEFLSKALSLGMGGSLTKATEKWRDSLDAVAASGGETVEKQQQLIAKSDELSFALQRTTAELIFQAAAADLDAETSLLLARRLGLIDEATFAVAQESQRLRIIYEETDQTAEDFAGTIGDLVDNVNSLTSKNIEITVDTLQASQNLSSLLGQIGVVSAGFGQTIASSTFGFQGGGQFQIPDNGQRGDSVPVSFMAEPGEVVTITPNDGGGPSPSNVTINNNISSDVDIAFFQQMLEDIL